MVSSPFHRLSGGYFVYDEASHALVGERTGETYRLGDRVEVELKEVTPVSGGIRFAMISSRPQGQASAAPSGSGSLKRQTQREAALSDAGDRIFTVGAGAAQTPRDLATLILVRSDGPELRVLLGRRHERHSLCRVNSSFPAARWMNPMPWFAQPSISNPARWQN